MKAQILKIAGVKSEKEFYKKYPSEEAFMKQHGKAFKKAAMGDLIGGASPKQFIPKQSELIDFQEIYDKGDRANTGSTEGERAKAAYDQAMIEASAAKGGGGGGGESGGMDMGSMMKMFGGSEGGGESGGGMGDMMSSMGSMGGGRNGTNVPRAQDGGSWWDNNSPGGSTNYGQPQPTYAGPNGPPREPVQPVGTNLTPAGNSPSGQTLSQLNPIPSAQQVQGGPSAATKTAKGLDPLGITGKLMEGYDQLRGERRARKQAEQNRAVSNVTRQASATREEESKRKYVRPEDIQNTGEEFFPIYGVGTNVLSRNGGRFQNGGYTPITNEQRDTPRTADQQSQINNNFEDMFYGAGAGSYSAGRDMWEGKKRQEAIDQLLYNKENGIGDSKYDTFQSGGRIGGNPTEIQNTYDGGNDIYTDGGYEPLNNPFQQKDFRHGGYLHVLQSGGGFSNWTNSMSGGGSGFSGAASAGGGAAGGGGVPYQKIADTATGAGQTAMGGQNAGGNIGGTVGHAIGSIWGPLGGAIGTVVGGIGGQLLDTNVKKINKANDQTKINTEAMALNSSMQALQGQNNRYVRNGGDIPNYEDGGYMNPEYNPQVITMFGDHNAKDFADYAHKFRAGGHLKEYTPPSEGAMETYAMGGQLQTHWGGGAETVSHNPYMPGSGETVLFRGQSHNESDGQGNTGIGITYGDNPVEVERGEPMFEMASGGEVNPMTGESENTGVVFGNMQVNKNIASQFKDPELMEIANKYNGKKFKNIGIELAKQEAKHNKAIIKNTDALEALKVNTPFDKLTLSALKANLEGADTGLKNIANTKITLANYQNAINDAKDEISEGVGKNISAEHLAKGYVKLDKDPVTKDAKWGATVSKAKDGITTTKETTVVPKKSKELLKAEGYTLRADGKYYKKHVGVKKPDTETKSASAMDYIPKQSADKATGLYGGVTPEQFQAYKEKNKWYDWKGFDPKKQEDVDKYRQAFNIESEKRGSKARMLSDEIDPKTKLPKENGKTKWVGKQFVSANIEDTKKSEVAPEEELVAEEDVPDVIGKSKPKFPWQIPANALLNYLRPSDQEELDYQQLYPEWNAMASNQLDPVPVQFYQPDLNVPYDISLQNERNAVVARDRALQKQLGYNPSAQSNAAPLGYNAINDINAREFQMNQAEKDKVYSGNRATMNQAQMTNLGIAADQWGKQALAKSNTKATTQAALNSIADKYAKHKLENRTLGVYENMYNYRFGKSGKAQNWNGLQFFDTDIAGATDRKDQEIPEGYKATAYDANGSPIRLQKITEKDDTDQTDTDLQNVKGMVDNLSSKKNGGGIKKNQKNSSVVRAYKNL